MITFKRKNFVFLIIATVLLSMIAGGYLYYWVYTSYLESRSLALYFAGMDHYRNGKFDEAAALFNRSLGVRDTFEPTLYLGMIHVDQGRYRLAMEYLQTSLQLLEKRKLSILPSNLVDSERKRVLNQISVLESKQKSTK